MSARCIAYAHKAHTHTHAHTLQHMQQPVPGRTPQSLHDGLGERAGHSRPIPSAQHASDRPSSPDVDVRRRGTTSACFLENESFPRPLSVPPAYPPPHTKSATQSFGPMAAVYTWEGGWAVHGRGEGGQAYTGRERGKKRQEVGAASPGVGRGLLLLGLHR